MPGGFHPFHAGHLALYDSAREAFPGAEVFVAATNDTSARPFPFAVKEKLAKLAGVAPGHFVQVKSPFRAEEITSKFDPGRDRLIFVRSEKDANKPPQAGGVKRDGSAAYLQPLAGQTNIRPFKEHAYMAYLPTVEFGPGMTSATEIRTAWPTLNEKRKTALVMSLYPRTQSNPKLAATVVKLLDAAIGTQDVAEGWGGALAGAIGGGMIGGPVGAAVGGLGGYVLGGGNSNADLPDDLESAYELGQQAARNGETEEDNPYEEKIWGADDAGQAWHDGWTDAQDDEDNEVEQPQVMPTKQASVPGPAPTKISGPADFSKLGFTSYKKESVEQGVAENFADGRNPQDKGDAKRHGVPTKASVSTLRKVAKQGGRKGQLAHWMANMKAGRAKNEDADSDYIEEKWSSEYKSSINCANPKGFSQKAHCAGRKK